MRVSNVAICSLAAFAAQDLTHEANASPSSQISTSEPEISNFVVEVKTIKPEQTEAVAPPETIATQQFTAAASEVEKSQTKSYQDFKTVVVVPVKESEGDPIPQTTSMMPFAFASQPVAQSPRDNTTESFSVGSNLSALAVAAPEKGSLVSECLVTRS